MPAEMRAEDEREPTERITGRGRRIAVVWVIFYGPTGGQSLTDENQASD